MQHIACLLHGTANGHYRAQPPAKGATKLLKKLVIAIIGVAGTPLDITRILFSTLPVLSELKILLAVERSLGMHDIK